MNKRSFIGTVTIVGVLGLTAYSIYLWRKQKETDEDTITVDEAREIARQFTDSDTKIREQFENTHREDIKGYEGINPTSYWGWEPQVEKEDSDDTIKVAMTPEELDAKIREDEERQVEEDIKKEQEKHIAEPEAVWHEDEGAGKLRHDPNSTEALYQFHRMELADWRPEDNTFQAMVQLYNIPFEPQNDGDVNLYTKLTHHREEFFGKSSRWNDKITFADVVTYFARRASYNLGNPYSFWVKHFISINDLEGMDDESLEVVVSDIVSHDHYNDGWDSWGLFGLCDNQMREAEDIARGYIDLSVTFEIEFNVFMKYWVEE